MNCRRGIWQKRRHLWWVVACALLALTSITLVQMLQDDGPFPYWVNVETQHRIDRLKAGYNQLPEFHATPGFNSTQGNGYFDTYSYDYYTKGIFGHATYDTAFWPDGDPGLGSANPLPPLIIRHELYAVNPVLPLILIGTGWITWGAMLLRRLFKTTRSKPERRRGFEVLPFEAGNGTGPISGRID